MKPGTIIVTDRIRQHFKNELVRGHSDYKAPKGEKFVALFLGTVQDDKLGKMDANKRLEWMGWKFVGDEEKL